MYSDTQAIPLLQVIEITKSNDVLTAAQCTKNRKFLLSVSQVSQVHFWTSTSKFVTLS